MARVGGHKRFITGFAAAGAAGLIFTSASFACTTFRGRMTIQGKGTGIVTVLGNNGDMTWCPSYPKGKAKANLGGEIVINLYKAGPLGDGCVPRKSKLPEGVYDVNYTNKGFTRTNIYDKDNTDATRQYSIDCMTILDPNREKRYKVIGEIGVDAFGRGTGTFRIPTTDYDGSPGVVSGPTDEAAICVSGRDGRNGLQAPVTIV